MCRVPTRCSKNNTLTLGGTVRHDEISLYESNMNNYRDIGSTTSTIDRSEGKANTFAVFAQDEWQLFKPLTLYTGVRVDYWTSYDGRSGNVGSIKSVDSHQQAEVSPRVSLVYTPLEDTVLRGSISKGFRAPNLYEQLRSWTSAGTSPITYIPNPNLKPETLWTYELGATQYLWERRIKAGLSVFHTDFTNYIDSVDAGTNIKQQQNVGRLTVDGLEAEASIKPFDWVSLWGNLTLNDSRIQKYNQNPAYVGHRLPTVPALQAQRRRGPVLEGREGQLHGQLRRSKLRQLRQQRRLRLLRHVHLLLGLGRQADLFANQAHGHHLQRVQRLQSEVLPLLRRTARHGAPGVQTEVLGGSMRITAIFWQSHAAMLSQGAQTVEGIDLRLYSTRAIDQDPDLMEAAIRDMGEADAVVLYRSAEAVWTELEPHIKRCAMERPLLSLSHDPSLWADSSLPMAMVRRAYDYVVLGGRENFANLLRFTAAVGLDGDGSDVPVPAAQPWEGFYHPSAPAPFYESHESFEKWHREYRATAGLTDAPVVGMLFSRHYWVNENKAVEDAIIRALEARGMAVVPVFSHGLKDANLGNKGSLAVVREAFTDERGQCRIQALVKLSTFFLGQEREEADEDGGQATGGVELFTKLNVPVFQPVVSSTRTIEEWLDDSRGLGQEIAWSVAMPEFKGVIEPLFVGAVSRDGKTDAGADLESRVPVEERCARLAGRVRRWVDMRLKPASERKVAFILNNNPCASVEASVGGAAKLDSLESVARVLTAMREAGYSVEVPESGKELIETIMERKAISEFRWTTVDEIVKKGGALELLPMDVYESWWKTFPEKVRERVVESWGNPPGEHLHGVPPSMVHEGKIIISGVQYGNAVVMVQPKRGCAGPRCDGQVCKILHDPEIPPPHQYLATYRWIGERFGADCVVHVGTHGNLEFLPGKNMGLSGTCLPDVCLHETPAPLHLQLRQPARRHHRQAPFLRHPGGPHADGHGPRRALRLPGRAGRPARPV